MLVQFHVQRDRQNYILITSRAAGLIRHIVWGMFATSATDVRSAFVLDKCHP